MSAPLKVAKRCLCFPKTRGKPSLSGVPMTFELFLMLTKTTDCAPNNDPRGILTDRGCSPFCVRRNKTSSPIQLRRARGLPTLSASMVVVMTASGRSAAPPGQNRTQLEKGRRRPRANRLDGGGTAQAQTTRKGCFMFLTLPVRFARSRTESRLITVLLAK